MSETKHTQNPALAVRNDDGLFLSGLIVAVETMERTWESQTYKQLKATITNGVKSFSFVASNRNGPLPKIEAFKRAKIAVEYANTEKGVVTVRGQLILE